MQGFGKPIRVVEKPSDATVLCVIDVAHAAQRSAHALAQLTTSAGIPSGHVYGVVEILRGILRNVVTMGSSVCFVFCYEGNEAKQERRKILPEYKANRVYGNFNPMPDVTMTVARIPGVHLRVQGMEGDDGMAWACERWSSEKDVIVVSGDRDLWGLLRYPRVGIFSPTLKSFVSLTHVAEEYGTSEPEKVYLAKALYGDSSDGIKGIPRLQKKVVSEIFKHCAANPTSFFETVDAGKFQFTPKMEEKLHSSENREIVARNFEVIKPLIKPNVEELALYQTATEDMRAAFEAQLLKFECKTLIDTVPIFFGAPFYPNTGA